MAVKASIQITISKVIDVYAVYRYYKLQSSTLAKPSKPTANPPSGWSDTEPAYVSGSTNTLYFVDCNVYSDKTFSFSEVSKSSSYEAAKDAWNKANNAQESIDNLEIGGRNLARKTSSEWTNWWVPTANKVNVCTALSYIYPGSIKVGDIFTVSFDIDIKKFTKSVDGNLRVFIQGSVDGSWTIVNPFGGYDITNKITSNDCTEHITYIAKIGSEAQASSSNFGFGIRCDYSDGTGKLRLKNLKVERGNKATDWTPAPEDAISTVSTEYYLSTSATSLSGGSWSTTAPTWANGKYMWSRTVITDGAGNKTYSPNQNGVCIAGAKGDKGDKGDIGATGKGVKSASVTYQSSTSGTTIPTGTWAKSIPSVSAGSFLWTRTVVTYTDNSTTTSYSVGKMGNTGTTGKGVKSTAITYQSSTSGTTVPTRTWQSSIPTVAAGSFLWTRTIITYTDNSTSTSYSIGKIGEKGDKGDKGDPGNAGKDAIIISATAPTSPKTGQLWQTASGEPIKRWDGSKWVLHYISVENLDVQKLSAIAADLGIVTAGMLKSKDDVTKFDVTNGVLESYDNNLNQTLKLSAGGITYIGKDAASNQMLSYLTFRGLVVRNINNLYGCSITLDESLDDFCVTKLINNGQGTDTVPLFSSLKQVPVSGTKVLTLTKGTNYVKLFTAAEVAALLGISSGNANHAMISVANGDAKAFNARVFGAEYWSDSDAWWAYFNDVASITQLVRINYMITRIDRQGRVVYEKAY